jgi:hypothetical protein
MSNIINQLKSYIESYKRSKTESRLKSLKLKYQVEIMDQQQELLKSVKQQIADKEKELISLRKMHHEVNQKYLKQRDSYRIEFAKNQRINVQLDKRLEEINAQAAKENIELDENLEIKSHSNHYINSIEDNVLVAIEAGNF